jgi:hypothetical protein
MQCRLTTFLDLCKLTFWYPAALFFLRWRVRNLLYTKQFSVDSPKLHLLTVKDWPNEMNYCNGMKSLEIMSGIENPENISSLVLL